MSLYRNFINVGVMTTSSRILGFVRDALVAAVLGTGPAADAYLAAFRFPNLFRRLFAEGRRNHHDHHRARQHVDLPTTTGQARK